MYKFSILADEQPIVISSANIVISDSLTLSQRSTTSLIKTLKIKGPNTLPFGVPKGTFYVSEEHGLILAFCRLPLK